jgi:hypothetical protein
LSFFGLLTGFKDGLRHLRNRIEEVVDPKYVFPYPCEWQGVVDDKPMVTGLEKFGQHVIDTFTQFFEEEVTKFKPPSLPPLSCCSSSPLTF